MATFTSRQLLGGVVAAVVTGGVTSGWLARSAATEAAGEARTKKAGGPPVVIVVPGGGLTPEGKPVPWVQKRLEKAASLYAECPRRGDRCIIATLSGGTPHKPMPTDPKSGYQVFEAEGNAQHLIRALGVPAEDVYEENWSLDTIANAFMFRAIHTDVAGWRRLVVVNNEFHMPRTRLIFEKVFGLPPVPAAGSYELEFVEVPDVGLEPEALQARKEREARSAEGFKKNSAQICSMRQMHDFIFSTHMAYSSKRLLVDREPVDPKVLASY